MALVHPLTMPTTPGWVDKDFHRVANEAVWLSPTSKQETILRRPGSHWAFTGILPIMNRAQAAPWRAFKAGLKVGEGTFWLPVPDYPGPLGSATVNGQVDGAAQTGIDINIKGLPFSTNGYALAGDFVQIESQCYELLSDIDSDVAGKATLDLNMEIRTSHADLATVNILTPKILMYDPEGISTVKTDKNHNVYVAIAGSEVVA